MNPRSIFSVFLILSSLLYLITIVHSLSKQEYRLAGELILTVGLCAIPAVLVSWLGFTVLESLLVDIPPLVLFYPSLY